MESVSCEIGEGLPRKACEAKMYVEGALSAWCVDMYGNASINTWGERRTQQEHEDHANAWRDVKTFQQLLKTRVSMKIASAICQNGYCLHLNRSRDKQNQQANSLNIMLLDSNSQREAGDSRWTAISRLQCRMLSKTSRVGLSTICSMIPQVVGCLHRGVYAILHTDPSFDPKNATSNHSCERVT